ncbi:MAG: AAA family ATPase [Planctomycetales bacterium]|nr:AAA family ATPase [Planctomycetales bacterium]
MNNYHPSEGKNKYGRPIEFRGIVGNQKTLRRITRCIASQSLPNLILLTGPTGCGKTTLGRIIARATLCRNKGIGEFEPCGRCSSCGIDSIHQHALFDELDSNLFCDERLIDLNHDLQNTGRVFLLDEIQELPQRYAQALKKSVEDIAAHLILCTTHPAQLDDALYNRLKANEFRLTRPTEQEVVDYLTMRCQMLGVTSDSPNQLLRVARAYNLEMRPCSQFPAKALVEANGCITDEYLDEVFGESECQPSAVIDSAVEVPFNRPLI